MNQPRGSQRPRTKKRLRKRKVNENPQADMSLVEHLQELRTRVIIALFAIAIGTVIGFIWYQVSIPGIPSLGDILRGPYCRISPELRADLTRDGECRLIATAPFEMFMLRLKVGALAGIVFSSPVWLWQIWAFVAPGMMKNERRVSVAFISVAVLLFVLGALIAYWVIAFGLELFLGLGRDVQITALSGALYFKFLLTSLIIFGISFEVPLFVVALNMFGLLHYEAVKGKRRFVIMTLFVIAAVITPGQDIVGMTVLGGSLSLLVEMAFQFMRWNDKRRKIERPAWLDVDDEQASALEPDHDVFSGPSGAVGASGDIRSSGPIEALSSLYEPSETTRPAPIQQPAPIDQRSNFDDVI
ncbi:twin-arginine translocase subunit TatC [Corynebacterium gerontici]|uniref:Sec-independent protein translocase protein TatC n=1 Tax=Corynebacterium gerontici TaxID=2079234 RepID=A0A3G6J5X6_9CORY|nr:twin-arginine translocase subunit TatC [Corynebacterium gerontici]AZA11414.1 Sec-independent protein translocase protein TatC [Corynebacterium gerontici]